MCPDRLYRHPLMTGHDDAKMIMEMDPVSISLHAIVTGWVDSMIDPV